MHEEMTMKLVIALGGSLIDFDEDYFERLKRFLKDLSKDHRIYVVVGGGEIARKYIDFGRKLGLEEEILDWIGIFATRLNAKLVSSILGANEEIPRSVEDAVKLDKGLVVMGGTTPGHSTDTVAAELAEKISADLLIIATDVDGIYDKDPKMHPDARFFGEVSVDKLQEICKKPWTRAGDRVIIDGPAVEVIKRSGFDVIVLNGKDLENLGRAIRREKFRGTKIRREG